MSTSKTAWEIVAKQDMAINQLDIAAAARDRIAAQMVADIEKTMVKEMVRRARQDRLASRLQVRGVSKDDAVAIAKKLLP